MDEAAEPVVPVDRGHGRARPGRRWVPWFGRGEPERTVRPMAVVVGYVLPQNMLQVRVVGDQQPVQALV